MRSKNSIKIGLTIIIVLVLIQNIAVNTNASSTYGIESITANPVPVPPETDFNVVVTVEDDTIVDRVRLIICQLSPNFLCEQPIVMEQSGTEFTGQFYVSYEEGTKLGYKIEVTFTNATIKTVPDSLDFLGIEGIVEPVSGEFYIEVSVEQPTESTNAPGFLLVGISSSFFAMICGKKRRN